MSADLDQGGGRRTGDGLHLAPDYVEPLPRSDAHRAYRVAGDVRIRLVGTAAAPRAPGAHRVPRRRRPW